MNTEVIIEECEVQASGALRFSGYPALTYGLAVEMQITVQPNAPEFGEMALLTTGDRLTLTFQKKE